MRGKRFVKTLAVREVEERNHTAQYTTMRIKSRPTIPEIMLSKEISNGQLQVDLLQLLI